MAIRAAVAARSNITFKILYNDVVAMTGGQPIDGSISVGMICRQVLAEGVTSCVVLTNEPGHQRNDLPTGIQVFSRDRLGEIQDQLRGICGVTVLIFDQKCAAEKRRMIKRGKLPPPIRRVFINKEVCEGCGDCSAESNCVSIKPVETPLGRKRAIDQGNCNEDLSCLKGFCPSFAVVEGARLRRRRTEELTVLAPRKLPSIDSRKAAERYNIVVAGVGGTGIVTMGAILAMAAHLEGKGAATHNMTGLAQKGGPVFSHIQISDNRKEVEPLRIDVGDADLVLACDLLAALSPEALQTIELGRTHAVVNANIEPSGAFQLFPDSKLPGASEVERFRSVIGSEHMFPVSATSLVEELAGDTAAANMFVLGYAYQKGLLPVSIDSIYEAININGVAIEFNRRAVELGREAAMQKLSETGCLDSCDSPGYQERFEAIVRDRKNRLVDYQSRAYAERYATRVRMILQAEVIRAPGKEGLAVAAARGYFHLLAYKDEYEVARLYSHPSFLESLRQVFEGPLRISVLLVPPLISWRRKGQKSARKRTFGQWVFVLFKVLAPFKFLRGTHFDPFGYTEERRMERRAIKEYEQLLDEVGAHVTMETHGVAVETLSIVEAVRGFGHVKRKALGQVREKQAMLLGEFRAALSQKGSHRE
jgi:indolepyruvate ferredoxin oxidoreductase